MNDLLKYLLIPQVHYSNWLYVFILLNIWVQIQMLSALRYNYMLNIMAINDLNKASLQISSYKYIYHIDFQTHKKYYFI